MFGRLRGGHPILPSKRGYKPPPSCGVPMLNLLFFGWVGNGKSSLINMLLSSFELLEKKERAPAASRAGHVTKEIRGYSSDGAAIKFWDVWGMSEENYQAGELELILDGHFPAGWKMSGPAPVAAAAAAAGAAGSGGSTSAAPLHRQMHGVSFVVAADVATQPASVAMHRVAEFLSVVQRRGIPIVVCLTKPDLIEPRVLVDPSELTESTKIQAVIASLSATLGVPSDHIFAVLNYVQSEKSLWLEQYALRPLHKLCELADDRLRRL